MIRVLYHMGLMILLSKQFPDSKVNFTDVNNDFQREETSHILMKIWCKIRQNLF